LTQQARPFPEYAALTGAFGAVLGGFVLLARRRLPERVPFGDVVRVGLASYKLGRLVAKDEVTTWMRAPVTQDPDASEPKPRGLERALGELVTCPYCVGVWVASGLSYALVLFPRQTRLVTTIFGAQAIADFLNAAYARLQED
jgi:hypothetical protein